MKKGENIFPDVGAIFVHIPKTGGTTIHHLFSQMESNIESVLRDNLEQAASDCRGMSKHAKADQYIECMGTKLWYCVFSFTFVRNPWDLMVSSYSWWLQKAYKFSHLQRMAEEVKALPDFEAFLESKYGQTRINEKIGNPRDWFGGSFVGRDRVSHVGLLERLPEEIKYITDQLEVCSKKLEIPRLNQSKRKSYQDYYSAKTRELVAARFSYEIHRFGYSF